MNFPESLGFKLNDITDEYEKIVIDGKLLIWKNINNYSWTLAYKDPDEYVYTYRVGSESDIEKGLKSYWRDKRLNELLN